MYWGDIIGKNGGVALTMFLLSFSEIIILVLIDNSPYNIVVNIILEKTANVFLSTEDKSWLRASPYGLIKEYFKFKQALLEDKKIQNLDKKMKLHQKKMCENKDNNEIYLLEKSRYESCKKELENNPVWQNFQIVQEEVYSILVDIKNILV